MQFQKQRHSNSYQAIMDFIEHNVFRDADILLEMEKEHLTKYYASADLKCAGDNLQALIDEAKLESTEGAGN